MLLGQTLEGMQVWDVRRAVQAMRSMQALKDVPIVLRAAGTLAGVALYASLYEPSVSSLELRDLPPSHMQGPHFLNVLRVLDLPQAVAMAAEKRNVRVETDNADTWQFAVQTAKALGWPDGRLVVSAAPQAPKQEPTH
jgi:hypothetical protein